MDEVVLSSGTIDAVGCAVTDLGVRYECIHVFQYQTIKGVVVDAASVHAQLW